MTIVLKPDQEKATQNAIDAGLVGSVEEFIETAIEEPPCCAETSSRGDVIRRMLEFGEMHQLSLGERISRRFLHEGHGF